MTRSRFLTLAFSLALAFPLVGCGGGSPTTPSNTAADQKAKYDEMMRMKNEAGAKMRTPADAGKVDPSKD